METKEYQVSKEANEKFATFTHSLKVQSSLFKKHNFCDGVLRFFTRRFGNKIKLKMGSRLLYKSFNRTYFFENLYKNLMALEYLSTIVDLSGPSIQYTVNDIGCGSAPSSIAYEMIFNHKESIQFNLKDNSHYQMLIAKKALQQRDISGVNINVSSLSAKDFVDMIGLTFFSYFLCEQSDKKIRSVVNKIGNVCGHFVFIDYENKLDYLEKCLNDEKALRFKLCVKLDDEIAQILNMETIKVNGMYLNKNR